MSEDASNLIKILESDASTRNSFFKVEKDNENKFTSCCFMSKRMKRLIEYFSDVVIIDTTHKTNRFNLPLMDIVVVNNLGQTCTCYFALLKNQKFESYKWALNNFKSQIKRNPQVIFTDDEESLTKGIFLFSQELMGF